MCGIAGILTNQMHVEELKNRIYSMQEALRHRGPDDEGIYLSTNHRAAFAHTRLSILDLSSAGHQPMSTANRRYHITFNGEIYNFRELRATLQEAGEQFNSLTDTEVILKLYQQLGAKCVELLRGMFAFAIWDDFEQTCFIARDPLGIKPLYYWQFGSCLVFGSELKAVLSSGLPNRQIDPLGLYGYLTSGSVPEPYTMVDGIRCLPAGHWLQWRSGKIQQQQYWKINFGNESTSLSEAQSIVRQALIDSIEHHFISDVPVGIFLSGGIDSTSIVALARQTQSNELRTYSIAFEEPEWSEGSIAKRTAQHFDTKHTEYCVTPESAKQLLPKFLATLDQPTIDGFNTFCVSKIAHDDGTKVVLSGLGGDEIFGGYRSFQSVPQMVRRSKSWQIFRPLSISLGKSLERFGRSSKTRRIGDFLQQSPTTSAAYRSFRGVFSHREACNIACRYLSDNLTLSRPTYPELGDFPSLEDEVSALELSQYMQNQLLRDSDVMSMSWGLELRVPFVDRNFIESIASISSTIRLSPGKQLLTQSLPELPPWVLNQPKRGFSFPLQQWLDNQWQDYFPENDKNLPISLNLWYRRWSIAILDHWCKQNIQ